MKNGKKHIILILMLVMSIVVNAQQLPIFTQYMLNKYVFNPAVTGTQDYFTATANYRYQWQGITDAPRTYILSVHGPHKFKPFGLGGALYTDVTGPTSRTGAYMSYAYHFKLNNEQKVSLGLSGGLMQYRLDGTKITLLDPGDLVLANSLLTKFLPDFGFGAMWYSEDYYVGLAVPQFIQSRIDFSDDGTQSLSKLTSHWYLNAGYNYWINEDFSVEPSMMMRFSWPVVPQIDLGLRGIYQDMFYLGTQFRTQDAWAILAGFQTPDEKFTFGYAYDITTSALNQFSNGSHELMVKAKFGEIKAKTKRKRRKMSKLERLQEKLRELDEAQEELDKQDPQNTDTTSTNTGDGDMDHYKDEKKDQTQENDQFEQPKEKSLEQQLADLEQRDRELRAKVRALRDEAESQGYSSPNDPNFPKREEYLKALDEIKEVYKKKKELDALLD